MPRKELDQSLVALTQAKRSTRWRSNTWRALESAGKKDQMKAAKGQLTSAQGKYERRRRPAFLLGDPQPDRWRGHRAAALSGRNRACGTPLLMVMDTSSVIARAHIPQVHAAI